MSNQTKISLTIKLEGSTLIERSYAERKAEAVMKKVEISKIPLVKSKPVYQTINIVEDAYLHFISVKPNSVSSHVWMRMGKKLKVESHLKEIAEHLGGKIESYHIFED